jgi:hypothetical protein
MTTANMERPVVSVDFCDLGAREIKTEHWLCKILQERFEVRLTTSPDFVFYGDEGDVHRMYTCVRIYVGGGKADFGECDFAVSVGGNGKWKMEDGKPSHDERVLKIRSSAGITDGEKQQLLSFFGNVFSATTPPIAAKKRLTGRWVLARKNS